MWRNTSRLWLGCGIAAVALALGCSHGPRTCTTCQAGVRSGLVDGKPISITSGADTSAYHAHPAPAPGAFPETEAKEVVAEAKPAEVAPQETTGWQRFGDPAKRSRWRERRAFVDVTADPAFAHAPDYSSLVGALERIQGEEGWRLRYASVDEEDRYNGRVTLAPSAPLQGVHSGQLVRVQGRILHDDEAGSPAVYRVDSLTPLRNP